MSEFRIRLSQRVYYDASVNADNFAEAVRVVARQLYEDDAEEPNMIEVDNGDFVIEQVQIDGDGNEVSVDAEVRAALIEARAKGRG
jgi:hypothetical protein